ncbi:MAG: hypothetical protein NPIRA01_36790 [Nitrospirales bacterium]|nr:MAG: hypothetical protein NPIRA01_36790 [Nitrospirales bacterium]
MTVISKELLDQFFELASEKLSGEWILLGGSVLPYVGRSIRATVDIDLATTSLRGGEQQLKLMEIAESLSLPIEAVNTAAEFFVRKISGFEDNLVHMFSKDDFCVYRPNVNLFIQLKLPRLSESDLEDTLEFLRFAREIEERVDVRLLEKLISKELEKGDHRMNRLKSLLEALPAVS